MIAAACCVESGRNLWIPEDCRYQEYNFLKIQILVELCLFLNSTESVLFLSTAMQISVKMAAILGGI